MNNKPTSTTVLEPTEIAVTQTIIRAQNGDVIVADETGLRMRLSDRVIEDIAMRLGKSGHGFGAMPQRDDTNNFLGDVDPSSQAEERPLSYPLGEWLQRTVQRHARPSFHVTMALCRGLLT